VATSRPAVETFTSQWNKAAAWAQAQGIPASTYLPVYQYDQQRLQNYGYGMSAAERNRAILAAQNPNNVTPAPTDNPNPSNVFGNARHDVASIATGLINLPEGLWHLTQNTVMDIADPKRLEAKTFGGTVGNWLNDTLLSLIPGAADVGTVLQTDPSLSGSSGAKKLAEHPLVSGLDVVPFGDIFGGLTARAAATTELGARLAGHLGMTPAQIGDASSASLIAKGIANITPSGRLSKLGVTLDNGMPRKLSLGEIVNSWAQGHNYTDVTKATRDLAAAVNDTGQMAFDTKNWIYAPFSEAVQHLSPAEKAKMGAILDNFALKKGDVVAQALDDPATTPALREALEQWQRVMSYEAEDKLSRLDEKGNPAVVALRTTDGGTGLYESSPVAEPAKAWKGAEKAREGFLRELEPTDRLVKHAQANRAVLETTAGKLTTALQAAQQRMATDSRLDETVSRPKTKFRAESIKRRPQAETLLGQGGEVESLIQLMKDGKIDQISALVPHMLRSLSRWDAKAMDASVDPAYMAVRDLVAQTSKVVSIGRRLTRAIDDRIYEREGQAQHEVTALDEHQQALRDRADAAKRERQAEGRSLRQRHSRERTLMGEKTRRARERNDLLRAQLIDAVRTRGDNAAVRATPEQLAEIMRGVRQEEARVNQAWLASRRKISHDDSIGTQALKDRHRAERAEQRLDHHKRLTAQTDRHREIVEGRKTAKAWLQAAKVYGDALRAYQESIWEHPPANYRDAYMAIYERNLLKHTKVMDTVKKGLQRKLSLTEREVAERTKDPRILAELSMLYFHDIFDDPTMDAELRSEATQARTEAATSARDEIQTLQAQGLDPPYVPVTHAWDESRVGKQIHPIVGRGIPKEDAVKARMFDLTSDRHNFEVAADKALRQTVMRDAHIDLLEHHIKPITVTAGQLRDFIVQMNGLGFGHGKTGTVPTSIEDAAVKYGLRKFDPKALYGFRLPSWGNEDLYLPASTVRALENINRHTELGLIGKGTEVFRFSILALSPRYTAHVLFGGTTMLALRSSPYALTMIGKAWKMVRTGQVDEFMRHTRNTEIGFQPDPLSEYNFRAAHDAVRLGAEEHIVLRQKIAIQAAKPLHWVKALGDLNYAFTGFVREMQSSIALLDGSAKAGRRGSFTDPVTGERVAMTAERMAYEGQHHVEQVFGNLRRMSPIERSIATSFMPFYGWTRHILGYVMTYPFDHPWRAMVLSQVAYHESAAVPKGLPMRLQFLLQLGSPDNMGNVTTVDTRFLDPFRDVANYASLTGYIQALNPAITAPLSFISPSLAQYGDNSLYPTLTYNDIYGISTAGNQGNLGTAVEQFIPQVGTLGTLMQAVGAARGEWQTNRKAAIKGIYQSLGIPGQVATVNLKQIAAKDEAARYQVAKAASAQALQTGDFSGLAGYASVPNPLNADYEISPQQLAAMYNQALAAYPGAPPAATLTPPPTPSGY